MELLRAGVMGYRRCPSGAEEYMEEAQGRSRKSSRSAARAWSEEMQGGVVWTVFGIEPGWGERKPKPLDADH